MLISLHRCLIYAVLLSRSWSMACLWGFVECELSGYSFLERVRICRQTNGAWINEWKRSLHPRGEYFWLTGEFDNYEPEAEDSDHWALGHGYVAVTPTQIDVTALWDDE